MSTWQIILWVGLGLAGFYAVWGYPKKYHSLSGRSRFYRTVGMGIILLLLTLSLLGTYVDFMAGVSRQVGLIRQFCWLATCFLLAFSLPLIAVLDALETYVAARREKREFVEQAIREEIEKARAKKVAAGEARVTTATAAPGVVEQRVGGNG
jgi:hypothetical protein